MPTNVFISFRRDNLEQVNSIRALANNPQHDLEFHDRSEKVPVMDKKGDPLPYQPDDNDRSKPIKNKLRPLLKKATKMVVIIGKQTYKSDWVNWEIQSFYDRYNNKSGDGDKRIIALYVQNTKNIKAPGIIGTLDIPQMNWDMNALTRWINTNPTQSLTTLPLLFQ